MSFNLFSRDSILSPHDKKQRLMLIVLAILILVILIVLYFGFRRSSPEPPVNTELPASSEFQQSESVPEKTNISANTSEELIEKINFDASFLENSRFKNLKVYGEWPLGVDEKGRTNPFLPY